MSAPELLDIDRPPDAKVLWDWVVRQRTCEKCAAVKANAAAITVAYRCVETKQNGWTKKHTKIWRLCNKCAGIIGTFDELISPVIQNLASVDLLDILVNVQPMNEPAARLFYADLPIIRGRRQHGAMLDDGNFRDEAAVFPLDLRCNVNGT